MLEAPRDGAAVETLNAVLAEQAGAPFVNVTSDPPHRLSWSADVCRTLRLDISAGVIDIFQYDAELVRKCTNPACVYLFLDISKSGRRRWCDMATCGNRQGGARHYAQPSDLSFASTSALTRAVMQNPGRFARDDRLARASANAGRHR